MHKLAERHVSARIGALHVTPLCPQRTYTNTVSTVNNIQHVAPGLARLRVAFVNLYLAGDPSSDAPWTLIDAGLPYSAHQIEKAAAARFGHGRKPEAILLTHGHFDHVGALDTLARRWDVPVYAHPLEMPYLTGRSDYPPPDPTVGGGAMARLACLYPRSGIDLGGRVQALPDEGTVPGLPDWRWVHTPGHSPGHVSFFRDADRVLVAGDAFVTVQQESATAVLLQAPQVHGPPAYFTPDWPSARQSVERLSALEPEVAATGHGVPMSGRLLRQQLERLAQDFDRVAVPTHGRYVGKPARADETGVVSLPPPTTTPGPCTWTAFAAAGAAGLGLALLLRRGSRD